MSCVHDSLEVQVYFVCACVCVCYNRLSIALMLPEPPLPPRHLDSLLPKRFRYKFFHAGNKATSRDLANVEVSWSKLNYLAYSPTITVGINYNPEPFHPARRL